MYLGTLFLVASYIVCEPLLSTYIRMCISKYKCAYADYERNILMYVAEYYYYLLMIMYIFANNSSCSLSFQTINFILRVFNFDTNPKNI